MEDITQQKKLCQLPRSSPAAAPYVRCSALRRWSSADTGLTTCCPLPLSLLPPSLPHSVSRQSSSARWRRCKSGCTSSSWTHPRSVSPRADGPIRLHIVPSLNHPHYDCTHPRLTTCITTIRPPLHEQKYVSRPSGLLPGLLRRQLPTNRPPPPPLQVRRALAGSRGGPGEPSLQPLPAITALKKLCLHPDMVSE